MDANVIHSLGNSWKVMKQN